MRRTPLVAGGFLAGAVFGALPPVQTLSAHLYCAANGGQWQALYRLCEYRAADVKPTGPGAAPWTMPLQIKYLDEERH